MVVCTPKQPILLVEDSQEDLVMTERNLRAAGLMNPILHYENGDDALEFLKERRGNKKHSSVPLPGIILLDLNLPGTDGRDVLSEIKQDDRLKLIPVIVVTTSSDDRDIHSCYALGANGYIQKPLGFEGLMKAMARLKDYWFEVVVMPKIEETP